MPPGANLDTENVLELINMFASTWFSLDAYDKDTLETKGMTRKKVFLPAEKLSNNLKKLKQWLLIFHSLSINISGGTIII